MRRLDVKRAPFQSAGDEALVVTALWWQTL
jgi:hypothetical protein